MTRTSSSRSPTSVSSSAADSGRSRGVVPAAGRGSPYAARPAPRPPARPMGGPGGRSLHNRAGRGHQRRARGEFGAPRPGRRLACRACTRCGPGVPDPGRGAARRWCADAGPTRDRTGLCRAGGAGVAPGHAGGSRSVAAPSGRRAPRRRRRHRRSRGARGGRCWRARPVVRADRVILECGSRRSNRHGRACDDIAGTAGVRRHESAGRVGSDRSRRAYRPRPGVRGRGRRRGGDRGRPRRSGFHPPFADIGGRPGECGRDRRAGRRLGRDGSRFPPRRSAGSRIVDGRRCPRRIGDGRDDVGRPHVSVRLRRGTAPSTDRPGAPTAHSRPRPRVGAARRRGAAAGTAPDAAADVRRDGRSAVRVRDRADAGAGHPGPGDRRVRRRQRSRRPVCVRCPARPPCAAVSVARTVGFAACTWSCRSSVR